MDQTTKFPMEFTYEEMLILQGALYEYIHSRDGDYINRRYPKSRGYGDNFRKQKAIDVERRRKLAEEMREQSFNSISALKQTPTN